MSMENKLEDVWFIGGGDESFIFTIVDRYGDKLDLSTSEIKWTLTEIGQKEAPLVIKDNKSIGGVIVTELGVCRIDIQPSDTNSLYSSIYEHELIVIQPNGKVLRPSFGRITIKEGSRYNI